jgi:tetratricopeptide (TPR) repeat protein
LLALEARLPALLLAKDRPTATDLREMARLCRDNGRPHASADLYALAFIAQPPMLDDMEGGSGNRYDAACVAARAGCGDGLDGAWIGGLDGAGLRQKSLAFLRADLAVLDKWFHEGKSVDLPLSLWQRESDLDGVRNPAALAKLPADERVGWQRLWADVTALRAADPLVEGRMCIGRRQWAPAAAAYARALKRRPTDDGHFWFEYAALLLLAGDRLGYAGACATMIEQYNKSGGPRSYHVARACTLAPVAVQDPSLPNRLAENELQTNAMEFWSLTEQGALHYRAGRFSQAVGLFEKSLRADHKSGRVVLNWLWLALAHQRLRKPEEARRWLVKAIDFLDRYPDGMPDRAEEELGLHLHNWLEAHVLRREAEVLIGPTESGRRSERAASPRSGPRASLHLTCPRPLLSFR